MVYYVPMKHLYDCLRGCAKEEEVKAEFCKFFKMKIFVLRGIDHYTEHVLFEFKYDRNFRNPENVARALAQVMYYARMLKFGAGLTKYPLPPYICVVDKNEAFFAETKDYTDLIALVDGSAAANSFPSTARATAFELPAVMDFCAKSTKLSNCTLALTVMSPSCSSRFSVVRSSLFVSAVSCL